MAMDPGPCFVYVPKKGPVSVVLDCTFSRHFVILLHSFLQIRLLVTEMEIFNFFFGRLGDELMGMTRAREQKERLKSTKPYIKVDFG